MHLSSLKFFYCTLFVVEDLVLIGLANVAMRIPESLALGDLFLALEQEVFVAGPQQILFILARLIAIDQVIRVRLLLIAAESAIAAKSSLFADAVYISACQSLRSIAKILPAADNFDLHGLVLRARLDLALDAFFEGLGSNERTFHPLLKFI